MYPYKQITFEDDLIEWREFGQLLKFFKIIPHKIILYLKLNLIFCFGLVINAFQFFFR